MVSAPGSDRFYLTWSSRARLLGYGGSCCWRRPSGIPGACVRLRRVVRPRRGSAPRLEVISFARGEEVITLAVVILAVIDPDDPATDHLEPVPLDHDGRRFVDPETEELRVGADDLDQVVRPVSGEDVLIDRHTPEVAEALFVTLGHQDIVTIARAPHQVGT